MAQRKPFFSCRNSTRKSKKRGGRRCSTKRKLNSEGEKGSQDNAAHVTPDNHDGSNFVLSYALKKPNKQTQSGCLGEGKGPNRKVQKLHRISKRRELYVSAGIYSKRAA